MSEAKERTDKYLRVLYQIIKLSKETPNDMDLGKEVRRLLIKEEETLKDKKSTE